MLDKVFLERFYFLERSPTDVVSPYSDNIGLQENIVYLLSWIEVDECSDIICVKSLTVHRNHDIYFNTYVFVIMDLFVLVLFLCFALKHDKNCCSCLSYIWVIIATLYSVSLLFEIITNDWIIGPIYSSKRHLC